MTNPPGPPTRPCVCSVSMLLCNHVASLHVAVSPLTEVHKDSRRMLCKLRDVCDVTMATRPRGADSLQCLWLILQAAQGERSQEYPGVSWGLLGYPETAHGAGVYALCTVGVLLLIQGSPDSLAPAIKRNLP